MNAYESCPWAVVPRDELGTCARRKGHEGKCSYRPDANESLRTTGEGGAA